MIRVPSFLTAVASSHRDDVILVCVCVCMPIFVGLNPELMLTWFGQVSQMERGHIGALIDSISLQILNGL